MTNTPVFSAETLFENVTKECEQFASKAALAEGITCIVLNAKGSRADMIEQLVNFKIDVIIIGQMDAADEEQLRFILSDQHYCGLEMTDLSIDDAKDLVRECLADQEDYTLAEKIINWLPTVQTEAERVSGLLDDKLAEFDEKALVSIATSSNFCGIEPCPLQPNIIEAIKAVALADSAIAENILNHTPAEKTDETPETIPEEPPAKAKQPAVDKDPVIALATTLDISPSEASKIIANKERKQSIKTERDAEEDRLQAELKQPLTRDDRIRMAQLSIDANRGKDHPDARDMAWLGRARQRINITPLNADERRRFNELDEIETTNIKLIGEERSEEITPLTDEQFAEYSGLKNRSELK